MAQDEFDRVEQRLKERMDAGDRANGDRIDQLYIDRSEDVAERRSFREEMRTDHQAVISQLNDLKQVLIPLPSLIVAVDALNKWRETHDIHHGKDDREIAHRIGVDEGVEQSDSKWEGRLMDALKFVTGGTFVGLVVGVAELMGKI